MSISKYNNSEIEPTTTYHIPSTTYQKAFTIVELLVVIVVIAILAAIAFVSYQGISSRATASTLQTDLSQASKQLKLYQVEHSAFPISFNSSNCPLDSAGAIDTKYCLKPSSNTTLAYQASDATNPQSFSLNAKATNNPNGNKYNITDSTSPTQLSTTCPTGYIVVPGSATYGTTDFCVMKYEAKDNGSGVAVSTATSLPWVSISQNTALAKSQAACTGCHLITEAEWMTLAQNVLGVASNWSGGAVGNGYIYSGHNDNAPANSLAADSSDANGYSGTGQTTGNQKRILNLSNGEVIWDMAGDVWEWTSGTSTTGQPGVAGNAYTPWIEWPSVTTTGTLTPSVFPSGTGIAGASTWTSANGIGQLISNPAEAGLRGFIRGGSWNNAAYAGVLTLYLNNAPSYVGTGLGFRAAR